MVSAVWLLNREPKTSTPALAVVNTPPLTDVAPSPPVVDIASEEEPAVPAEPMVTQEQPKKVILPEIEMDVHNPPQWTQTMAVPQAYPQAPDPLVPPPIEVDPRRQP